MPAATTSASPVTRTPSATRVAAGPETPRLGAAAVTSPDITAEVDRMALT